MSASRLRAVALAALTISVLLLAACGGGESRPDATTKPPTRQTVRTVSDVAYEQDADGTRQALTVHAPAKGGPWPTAVMIHGSGNSPLDQWASSVASRGVVVFVPYWPEESLSRNFLKPSDGLEPSTPS